MKQLKVKDKDILTDEEVKRLHILFKRNQKAIGNYKSLVSFEQPVLLLIRNGKVEFYEGVKGDTFRIPDDEVGRIIRLGTNLLEFEYGKETFKGYICNVDEAFPLPQKPIVYAELMELIIRKIITNYKNLESSGSEMRKTMWAIFGMLILGAIIYVFFLKDKLDPNTAAQIANQTVQNLTTIAANMTKIQSV